LVSMFLYPVSPPPLGRSYLRFFFFFVNLFLCDCSRPWVCGPLFFSPPWFFLFARDHILMFAAYGALGGVFCCRPEWAGKLFFFPYDPLSNVKEMVPPLVTPDPFKVIRPVEPFPVLVCSPSPRPFSIVCRKFTVWFFAI